MLVRRHRLVLGFFLLAVPLGIASAAYGCQSLATLHTNPRVTAGVGTMTITGNGFEPSPSPVVLRLDSLDSRETVATVRTNSTGGFAVDVPTPDVAVGYHFFVALQLDEQGNPTAGTPVRASFQVLPAKASFRAVPNGPGHPHELGHPNATRSSVLDLGALTSPFGLASLAFSAAVGLRVSRRRSRKL